MIRPLFVSISMEPGQKGAVFSQAIGRSRDGLTTKIHAVVDNPLRLELTAGQRHDSVMGYEMLKSVNLTQKQVVADRAYDTNRILKLLEEQEATPVIPSKKNRRVQRKWDMDGIMKTDLKKSVL